MDEVISFLEARGHLPTEGSSSPEQQNYLRNLVTQSGARLVGEIGFNAGLSSLAFLSASPDVQVVSFDIGCHDVVGHAKEFVDAQYPGRHELIIGDSALSVPKYLESTSCILRSTSFSSMADTSMSKHEKTSRI